MKRSRLPMLALICSLLLCGPLSAQAKKSALPGQYFRLPAAGAAQVEIRLNAQASPGLKSLETVPLRLKSRPGHSIRPNERKISLILRVGERTRTSPTPDDAQ